MSENKKLFDRKYTRRQFLKISGKGLAGVAVSASLLNLIGCEEKQIKNGEIFTWATPTGLLVVNKDKCVGCHRCEMNCNLQNDGNRIQPFIARLNLRDNYYFGEELHDDYLHNPGVIGNFRWEPVTCKQCANPWCGNACPVDAIYADEKTGTRLIDKEKCIACGACTKACPWHLPKIDPEENVSTKCINCGACVRGCITGAIEMVKWEDVATALAQTK